MKRHVTISAALLVAIACPFLTHADVVELKDGRRIEGKVVAKSRKAVMVQTVSGEFREVDPADIKQITEGNVKIASSPEKAAEPAKSSSVSPSVSASKPLAPGSEARGKLAANLRQIMVGMEKEKLEAWPEREPKTPRDLKNDPTGMTWKVQMKDGTIRYFDKAPEPLDEYVKVWAYTSPSSGMKTIVIDYNTGRSYSSFNPKWTRMYWWTKMKQWNIYHDIYRAFLDNDSCVMGFLNALDASVDTGRDETASHFWYELLNCRAGAKRPEEEAQKIITSASAKLKEVCLLKGNAIGIGDSMWRIYELSMKIEEKVTPATTDAERLALAKERQALCRQVADSFQEGK